MAAQHKVDIVDSRGCSKLIIGTPASSSHAGGWVPPDKGPLSGLVICVTGLSKEARRQVMEATRQLGGEYSSSLHAQCTHLVVQRSGGRKFEHALKHGHRNDLSVVRIGWFVDSVRLNVRLDESMYAVKNAGENLMPSMELSRAVVAYGSAEKSCVPASVREESRPSNRQSGAGFSMREPRTMDMGRVFADDYVYIDPHISEEVKRKIVDALGEESVRLLDCWFAGCHATYVICEGSRVQKYVGHAQHVVTPSWVFKSIKEKQRQRLVHLSTDIAREVALVLGNVQNNHESPTNFKELLTRRNHQGIIEERKRSVDLAKMGVRNRRMHRMQTCQMPLLPITPNKLVDSICWSISEPATSAGIYVESCNPGDAEDRGVDDRATIASAENQVRLLRESEKLDIVFRSHFLTILFPIDRFGELGPSSRTFFSDGGFSCIQVLDHIYNFYQENMTENEVSVAIHTDSRHGDRLRSLYVSNESTDHGSVPCKRIDFLGSRRSFEMLKCVAGENGNVYELLVHA